MCINKGSLTDTFRTAIIGLIPKKGDTKLLKNWRPISLLSCYYKIIYKALNALLGTVIGKVTSMAQKAYSPDRYMHDAVEDSKPASYGVRIYCISSHDRGKQ